MFALWYDASNRKVSAINGSGRSPSNLTLDKVNQFYSSSSMSDLHSKFTMGVHAITVPGAAQGWEDVRRKYGSGRLTLLQVLEPAITLAREGFPVSTLTAMRWSEQMKCITKWYTKEEIARGQVEMSVDGKGMGPVPGQLFRNPHLANVMQSLGEHGAKDGFYNAFPGKSIVEAIQKHGGTMTLDDLVNHTSTFPEPVKVRYNGIDVWEVPPNGQGIAGLIALEGVTTIEENGYLYSDEPIIDGTTHPQSSCEMLHAQIEMMRLGFGDARAHVCDPDFAKQTESSAEWLLDKKRIFYRVLKLFNPEKATVQGMPDASSCTVSFQAVDEDGNAMSFVNR
jgi:gamma-glutamyltranspeptidase/glutathione hydrolase